MSVRITNPLVEHVLNTEYDTIPKSAIEVQKRSLADILSVMLAATSLEPSAAPFLTLAESFADRGQCTLLGSKTRVSPAMAALANGALVHALDFEDSHELATVHPNSASTPAFLALAEYYGGVSGKDFLTAMVLASDICCRLDLGANEDLLKYGWNMPPIHGSMGAVMGAAKLAGLNYEQIMDAIALNMSQVTSSGEGAMSRGSAIRAVREGFAAEAVVKSILLAKLGVPARFESPFEGKLGYYHMYAHDNYTPERVIQDLGKVWESAFISFKPWPSCRATHTSIEAVLEMEQAHDIRPEEVENVHVVMQEIGRMVLEPKEAKYRPQSASIGKFSLPFVVATAIRYGEVTLDSFSEERLSDPELLRLCDKVTYEIDEKLTKAQNKFTDISIRTPRGTFLRHKEFPLGCVENPMSEEQMRAKFFSCARLASKRYTEERLEEIYQCISHVDELKDMRELMDLLL